MRKSTAGVPGLKKDQDILSKILWIKHRLTKPRRSSDQRERYLDIKMARGLGLAMRSINQNLYAIEKNVLDPLLRVRGS